SRRDDVLTRVDWVRDAHERARSRRDRDGALDAVTRVRERPVRIGRDRRSRRRTDVAVLEHREDDAARLGSGGTGVRARRSRVCVRGAAPPGADGENTVPTTSARVSWPLPGVPVTVMSTLALMSAPTAMSPVPLLVSSSQAAIPKLSVAAKRPDASCLHVFRFI